MEVSLSKSKITWVASLILAIWLYTIYYSLIHPSLLKTYKDQFYLVPFVCNEVDCSSKEMSTTVIVPKYLVGIQSQVVYVKVQNNGDDRVAGNMVLVFDGDTAGGLNEMGTLPLLFNSGYDANIQVGSVFEFDLRPHDSMVAQIYFLVGEDALSMDDVYLYYEPSVGNDEDVLRPNTKYGNIKINIVNSSFSVLLSKIILPPWANGILPALSLLSCWLVESRVIKKYPAFLEKKDEVPVSIFSNEGMVAVGYFFVLGNLFSLSIILVFLLALWLSAPTLLIVIPSVLFGVWALSEGTMNSSLERVVNFLNKPAALALIILFLSVLSIKANFDVLSNDVQMFNIMDGDEKAIFIMRNIALFFLYIVFVVIALKIFGFKKKKTNVNRNDSKRPDVEEKNNELVDINRVLVDTSSQNEIPRSSGNASFNDIKKEGVDDIFNEIQDKMVDAIVDGVVSLDILAKLESMKTIAENISLTDISISEQNTDVSFDRMKTLNSVKGDAVEYVCNNCGAYQGKIQTEKCSNCNSVDIVVKI